MRGFQIWSHSSNRITSDPLVGQKTVEDWQNRVISHGSQLKWSLTGCQWFFLSGHFISSPTTVLTECAYRPTNEPLGTPSDRKTSAKRFSLGRISRLRITLTHVEPRICGYKVWCGYPALSIKYHMKMFYWWQCTICKYLQDRHVYAQTDPKLVSTSQKM